MQVQPYLFFEGCAEAALDFYKSAAGAKVEMMMRYSDAPKDGAEPPKPGADCMVPPGAENKIMHLCFKIGDTAIMGSDGRCSGKPSFGGFALSLAASTPAEGEKLFGALGAGGQVVMPMGKTFFADAFGMVTDKFGVMWMIIAGPKH